MPRIVSYDAKPPVLRCSGDEDRATRALRRRALSRAQRADDHVQVDLHELWFADASLMVDLAMLARRLRPSGREVHLVGAQPQIHKLIELVGIDRLAGVRVEDDDLPR